MKLKDFTPFEVALWEKESQLSLGATFPIHISLMTHSWEDSRIPQRNLGVS